MYRILPPLLDSPCEGELHLVLSGARVSPSLSAELDIVVSGKWWGDNEGFSCRMSAPEGSAKAVFGVCCNGSSFRQYMLDAKTLVLSLHTHSVQEINEKDLTLSISDQLILNENILAEIPPKKSSVESTVLKPLNLSPSKRLQSFSPKKKRSPTKSKPSVMSAADLPKYLLGTPRHRLLEKQRTTWLPGEEVGEVVVNSLKLNSRGELMCQCNIINMFGDERGTLDVTMIYYENIALLKLSLDENKVLSSPHSSKAIFSLDKGKHLSSENKENVNRVSPYELPSSSVVNESFKMESIADLSEFSNQQTESSHHISFEGIPQTSGNDSSGLMHCGNENFRERRGSSVSLSDESVLAYLKQLDPQSLVECGAIRKDDLPKFLKLIQDCTLEDENYPEMSFPRSSEHATSAYCSAACSDKSRQAADSRVYGAADGYSARSIETEIGDFRPDVLLAHNSVTESTKIFDANFNSGRRLELNNNRTSKTSCSDNIQKKFTDESRSSQPVSHDNQRLDNANFYTARPGNVLNSPRNIFSSKKTWNSSQETVDAVGTTDCANVVSSEPSVMSLPSGVWPLDDSPAFSQLPFCGADKELGIANLNQRGENECSYEVHQDPGVSHASIFPKLDVCSDLQTSAHQFPPDERKVLDDSFLSKLKYKAITSDGKEIVMDCKRLAQLTRPPFHFTGSHVQPTSDWKENVGENLNHPRTSQSDSPVLQRKLWKNLKNNFNSSILVDSQLGASRPQDLFDTVHGEMPSPWQNNQEDSDTESDTSGASNETYTTSTLNNPDESPTHASPGSVLLVEVKELTLRGAAPPLQHSVRPGLRGVKNRSNVCILTSLTVSAPAPCEAALSSPSDDVSSLTPPQTYPLHREQHSDQEKALSEEPMGPNKPQYYTAQMHSQVLPQSQMLSGKELIARGQVPSQEGVLPPAQQRGEAAGWPTPGDGGLQTITLASRHLDKDTVHYGSVQAFGLSGLKDPAQLQKVTLLIRVFRRVLGRQKSEELCSAEISLWDVYRLVHGHLVIPLSPTSSCSARATRHSSVDDAVLRSPARLVASRRSPESGAENQRMVHSNDSNIMQGGYSDFSKKHVHSSRHGISGGRLSAGNVRSTHADRDYPSGGGMSARGRGFKCLRGSKPNSARNNDGSKPVSGEISIFLKLFLNEQYVNEFRNSIVEDPSVLASFVQRRRCADQQGLEDSVEAEVITVLPNLNRSQTTRLLDHVTRHNNADLPSVQPAGNFSIACNLSKFSNTSDNVVRDTFRTSDCEAAKKSTLTHSSAGNPPAANVYLPTENHSSFTLTSGNQVDRSYSSGRVVKTHDEFSELGTFGPNTVEALTVQPSKQMIQQVSKSPTRQLSESSSELVAQPLTQPKYESQTGRTFALPARTLPRPSVTSPRLCNKEHKSKGHTSSAPLECVLGSSSDPSVSFIQTLSQQYHQNTEYFIRIHVEILEAKNLESVSDGLGGRVPPCSYVRASFFGENVTTAVCGPSAFPVWNFASQIVVSSLEINNGCSSIVVRVHHRGQDGAPLLGCLALRPPSPFWPGQVSLCGWYPLLSVRARLAGHIKLSLTIVESVLGDESSGATLPAASSAPAASASSAPGVAAHTSQRQPSTRVDCPGASSSDHESKNSPFKTRLFGLNDSYQCSAQHDSYTRGTTSTECNINGFREEVNLPNSLSQNGGVNDRIIFEESAPKHRIVPNNEYMHTAVLEKRVLNEQIEHGHLTSRTNDHCRSWDQVSSNSEQERSSSASVDRSASHLDYANHSIERYNTCVESKGDVSEDYFVSRASYLASDSKWGCSGQSNKHFNSSLNPPLSMSTSTNTVSLLQRNPSEPSPVCSVLEPVTSCARKGRENAPSVEPPSCIKSSAFAIRSVTDVEARAGSENVPDTYIRQMENDYTCSQPPFNVELMNDVFPAASSFPSCLRTVDSPRGLSKKVKFAVDKRLSLSSVSAICTSGLDHPQDETLSKYEETLRGCGSSSAREPFHKHSQDSDRITEEKLRSQHEVSVAAVEDRLQDIQHELYSPPLRRSCDQESSRTECYNYRSEKQGAGHGNKCQHMDKYQHMDRLVDRSTMAPESRGVKMTAETRNIASLLESFSWMNLVKDNDSPCMSYIDAVKRPSTPSKNSEFFTDHNERQIPRVATSDAPSNYVLISRQSPVTDSGLTSEVGSASHRSSDADSPRCAASPDAAGRDHEFGAQTPLETQASTAGNPRLSAERKNNPKSRLAANFSFNKRPR